MTTVVKPQLPRYVIEKQIEQLKTEMQGLKNRIVPLEQALSEIRERDFLYDLAQLCNKHRMWINCDTDDSMWACEMKPGQNATPENVLENRE